jgi:transcriptional regulator with XRE-family HTH domain
MFPIRYALFDENGVLELEQSNHAQGGFKEWIMDRPIDVTALYVALDARRNRQKLSWRELAKELGLSSSIFTRLAQGRAPELSSYRKMTDWLGVGMDDFTERERPSVEQSEDTVEAIAAYLRADKALKPESAQAIETIVRAAYEEMADRG